MRTVLSPHTRLLLALALIMPLGCRDGDQVVPPANAGSETGEGNDEVGEDPPDEVCKSSCQECADLMKDAYACMPFDESEEPLAEFFSCIVCENDGVGTAVITCETQANLESVIYATMDAQPMVCDSDSMEGAKCTSWNPNQHVHPTSDEEWDVERDFIDALVADPSQLVGCDGARVEPFHGFYRVTSVDSDDLLGRLGS